MQKFAQNKVVVQKRIKHHKKKKKEIREKAGPKKTPEERKEDAENGWQKIVDSLSVVLANDINIPEEERPVPFDAASDKHIDEQRWVLLSDVYLCFL